jgi:hypothetical protein
MGNQLTRTRTLLALDTQGFLVPLEMRDLQSLLRDCVPRLLDFEFKAGCFHLVLCNRRLLTLLLIDHILHVVFGLLLILFELIRALIQLGNCYTLQNRTHHTIHSSYAHARTVGRYPSIDPPTSRD